MLEGWDNFCLSRQDKGEEKSNWWDSNLEPIAWPSNSGEVKDRSDHSATGHYLFSDDLQRTVPANI